jgi:hypothetical protein
MKISVIIFSKIYFTTNFSLNIYNLKVKNVAIFEFIATNLQIKTQNIGGKTY